MSTPEGTEPRGRLTYADYASLPDDGRRYQLVEGELVVMASPNTRHQLIVGEIYHRLRLHVDAARIGRVMVAPLDVVLDDHNVLQPDVLFVSTERRGVVVPQNLRGAPDLCVEVLSPGTERLDRVRKLELVRALRGPPLLDRRSRRPHHRGVPASGRGLSRTERHLVR